MQPAVPLCHPSQYTAYLQQGPSLLHLSHNSAAIHLHLSATLWAPWGQESHITSFLCFLNTQDCTWSGMMIKEHFSKQTHESLFSLAETISGIGTNRHETKGHYETWLTCLSSQGMITALSNRVYFQDTPSRQWGAHCLSRFLQLQNPQFLQGTWTARVRVHFPVSLQWSSSW